jgi:hypothetical protein
MAWRTSVAKWERRVRAGREGAAGAVIGSGGGAGAAGIGAGAAGGGGTGAGVAGGPDDAAAGGDRGGPGSDPSAASARGSHDPSAGSAGAPGAPGAADASGTTASGTTAIGTTAIGTTAGGPTAIGPTACGPATPTVLAMLPATALSPYGAATPATLLLTPTRLVVIGPDDNVRHSFELAGVTAFDESLMDRNLLVVVVARGRPHEPGRYPFVLAPGGKGEILRGVRRLGWGGPGWG